MRLLEAHGSKEDAEEALHIHAKLLRSLGLTEEYGVKALNKSGTGWGVWLVHRPDGQKEEE